MRNQGSVPVGGGVAVGGGGEAGEGRWEGLPPPNHLIIRFLKRLNADKKVEGGRWRYEVRGKRTCRKLSIQFFL